jgi:hypothetical protein
MKNFSSVRDARETAATPIAISASSARAKRSTFHVGGKTMAVAYAQIVAAGFIHMSLADPTPLGSATFPRGSAVFCKTNTPFAEAISPRV